MSPFLKLARAIFSPFQALVRHRHTIEAFARQDIRSRYVASVLGLSWAVIHPLTLLVLYTFVFSIVLKVRLGAEETTASFGAYLFCGLLPWFAFSEGVIRASGVIMEHANLIKKVVFPSEILPAYVVVSSLFTEFIALVFFCVVIAVFLHGLGWVLPALSIVVFFQFLFTMGLGWLVASVNVFLRDVGQLTRLVMTVWMFVTPILYPAELIPDRFRFLLAANPLHHIVSSYRSIILDQRFPPGSQVGLLALMAVATFLAGYWLFRRSHRAFADVL